MCSEDHAWWTGMIPVQLPGTGKDQNDIVLISVIFCHMSASCIYHATLLKMNI